MRTAELPREHSFAFAPTVCCIVALTLWKQQHLCPSA